MPNCPICYGYPYEGEHCPICGFPAHSNPERIAYWEVVYRHPARPEQLFRRLFPKDYEWAKTWREMLERMGYMDVRIMPVYERSNPQEVPSPVRPENIAKWKAWGVPEDIIEKAIRQRIYATELRRIEEKITVEGFAYPMPRLPKVEAEPWGTAKAIDFEGTIIVHQPFVADRIRKIDRWLYRWEYYRPRITIKTRTYELTEEIANMWHTIVTIKYAWDIRLKAYAIDYETHAASARAVRICQLTQPHLTHPDKKARAKEILTLYRERPSIPRI